MVVILTGMDPNVKRVRMVCMGFTVIRDVLKDVNKEDVKRTVAIVTMAVYKDLTVITVVLVSLVYLEIRVNKIVLKIAIKCTAIDRLADAFWAVLTDGEVISAMFPLRQERAGFKG